MYSVQRLKRLSIKKFFSVVRILHKCGKDMAKNQGLMHWNNSYLKTCVIVALCVLKNDVYLVYDGKAPVATFQVRLNNGSVVFQKLATSPEYAGRGIGRRCLFEIERIGRAGGCNSVLCEVYDKSEHAIRFYEKCGFIECGTEKTRKYSQIKMRKQL